MGGGQVVVAAHELAHTVGLTHESGPPGQTISTGGFGLTDEQKAEVERILGVSVESVLLPVGHGYARIRGSGDIPRGQLSFGPNPNEAALTAHAIEVAFRDDFERVLGVSLPPLIEYRLRSRAQGPTGGAIGWVTSGEGGNAGRVWLDWEYLRENPADVGLVIHELFHAAFAGRTVQVNPHSNWIHEGLADYAAYRLVGKPLPPEPGPLREGYGNAARFFDWMERTKPGSVKSFIAALTAGMTSTQASIATTGLDIDALRRAYYAGRRRPGV